MDEFASKTVAVFDQAFSLPGFDGAFPAGEYDVETELPSPPDYRDPGAWSASVVVNLQPCLSPPGMHWSLTAPLVDFDATSAKDKFSGKELTDFFLEEILLDPMVQLVIEADGVSAAQLRQLYSAYRESKTAVTSPGPAET